MSIMLGQYLTEVICYNPKTHEKAVLSEIDKDLVTGLATVPAVILFACFI